MKSIEDEIRRNILGEVRFDQYSKAMYSTDASIYQIEPVGVVIPRSYDDVIRVVEMANRLSIPILPRGGGTSLAGQTVNNAIVLDFTKFMNNVLDVNVEEQWAIVQPGITLDELNRQVKKFDLHYAPDPTTASRATVGGGIGNNSCGSHSIVYGRTSDSIIEIEAILSDSSKVIFTELDGDSLLKKMNQLDLEGSIYRGVKSIIDDNREEIIERFPDILRKNSGYGLDFIAKNGINNIAKLLVGSEGTLATVISAKVKLFPIPKARGLAVIHFDSLIDAMKATVESIKHDPSAIEVIDKLILDSARNSTGFAKYTEILKGNPSSLLVVEFFGQDENEIEEKLNLFKTVMDEKKLGYHTLIISKPSEQKNIWEIRSAGLGLLMGIKGDTKPLPFVEDTAVSPERLPEYVEKFDEIVRRNGTTAAYYGHASVGCLHIRPLINIKDQKGLDQLVRISDEVSDLVLEFGGSLSGEHGDGIVRGVWNEKMFGSKLYDAFRTIKHIFDPNNIMNPGKIIDCPPMTDNLRLSPKYETYNFETIYDFSKDHGLSGAIELCSGVGACRKSEGGVMCPSYMATREEEHSTRGRANALRTVLSGKIDPKSIASKRLYEVMDLCLGCKACKSECPSNVDMAKIKSEFLNNYYKSHKPSIRTRIFANISRNTKMGFPFRSVWNFFAKWKIIRLIGEILLGIDSRRELPSLATHTFRSWFNNRLGAVQNKNNRVALLVDTYTNYYVPEIGKAAVNVLEKLGYEVILPEQPCCGRTMASSGLLDSAKTNALMNVNILYPFISEGVKIVGLEPSCLLMIRDDYLDLLPSDSRAKELSNHAYLFEEFLNEICGDNPILLDIFGALNKDVIYHGHCHQKSLVGGNVFNSILSTILGVNVQEIDSGCCGMAGSFGYEKEHYELSMSIGEQRLFPEIRNNPNQYVVSNGYSCRQQIFDGTNSQPLHITQLLSMAIDQSND
ncbi:MAG: oxidoreductase [Chloroflexi bacterium]|nr:oxidoreductase [Chloroflexota bacterium]